MRLLIITQKVDANDQLLGFFILWLEKFSQHFEKVTVFCQEKEGTMLPGNVAVVSLGKDRGRSRLSQLAALYRLSYDYRNDYDAVFVHMAPVWVAVGGWFWHLLGKKIALWYTHKTVTTKLRIAEKFADVIFTASPESFRLKSSKVIVTGHGIDTEVFHLDETKDPSPLALLSVGRISPVKNYEVLIDAAGILKNKGVHFTVTIVGEPALESDKEYLRKLKNKILEKGLNEYFIFVGKKTNRELVSIYQTHGMFVHMSRTGSVDKVLLEAMASGMRVVSSNDSARSFLPSEIVFDGNNPNELAGKIALAANEPVPLRLRTYVVEHHNLNALIRKIHQQLS